MAHLVTLSDVLAAAKGLGGVTTKAPLLENPDVNERLGRLTAATVVVMADASREAQVFAVKPVLFDDTRQSLITGEHVGNPTGRRTICDAIMTPIPNAVTYPVNHALLARALVATDAMVRAAMRFAYEHFKIVTEPGAVVGLAAILTGKVPINGRALATVITGGKIDPARFAALLDTMEPPQQQDLPT